MSRALIVLVVACVVCNTFASPAPKKVFTRCELVNWLRGQNASNVRTWTCLAFYESSYNSSAMGPVNSNGSRDHGMWQVNDYYWCDNDSGSGYNDCNIRCVFLRDDDLTDDWECVQFIENRQGFTAWSTWPNCDNAENESSWDQGC